MEARKIITQATQFCTDCALVLPKTYLESRTTQSWRALRLLTDGVILRIEF